MSTDAVEMSLRSIEACSAGPRAVRRAGRRAGDARGLRRRRRARADDEPLPPLPTWCSRPGSRGPLCERCAAGRCPRRRTYRVEVRDVDEWVRKVAPARG